MPTAYKIELSPNSRAGCKSPLCKDAGTKLMKDELRLGSWVTIHDHGSWAYRHWGCTTPDVIKNINIHIEGKMDIIDGWEELDDQMQGKVRRTMEQGHVDDDDWMGEPAYNRPGMHGMFYKEKRPRRRKDPETGEFIDPPTSTQTDGESGTTPKKMTPARARARKTPKAKAEPADTGSEVETPVKVEKKPRKKAVKEEVAQLSEVEEKPQRARPTGRRGAVKEEIAQLSEVEEKAQKARPTRKQKAVKYEDPASEEGADVKVSTRPVEAARSRKQPEPERPDPTPEPETQVIVKPKPLRNGKQAKGRPVKVEASEDGYDIHIELEIKIKEKEEEEEEEEQEEQEEQEETKPKANRGRKRKAVDEKPPLADKKVRAAGETDTAPPKRRAPKRLGKGR